MNPISVRNTMLLAATAVAASVGAPLLVRSTMTNTAVKVAEGPATAIDNATKEIAANTQEVYKGFDTNVYPGDNAMDAWRRSGEYEWVGYYLPGGCHKDPSWSGKRKRLVETGWGLAVVYVGQQTWGKSLGGATKQQARSSSAGRNPVQAMSRNSSTPIANSGDTCAASLVSAERGKLDAADAIAKAAAEGFEKGTIIFLDVERMENIPDAMRDYYRAWTKAVLEHGQFRPGVYAHTHNAEDIYNDLREVFTAAGVSGEPSFWIAGTRGFKEGKPPTGVGHAFADVWQGLLDVVRTHEGVKLPVDVNVSAVPSPSAVNTQ